MSDSMPATPTDLEPIPEAQEIADGTEKPEADEEVIARDDITVDGELEGTPETGYQYLIRFTPERDLGLCLILTTDGEAQATLIDEENGTGKQFTPEETEETEKTETVTREE